MLTWLLSLMLAQKAQYQDNRPHGAAASTRPAELIQLLRALDVRDSIERVVVLPYRHYAMTITQVGQGLPAFQSVLRAENLRFYGTEAVALNRIAIDETVLPTPEEELKVVTVWDGARSATIKRIVRTPRQPNLARGETLEEGKISNKRGTDLRSTLPSEFGLRRTHLTWNDYIEHYTHWAFMGRETVNGRNCAKFIYYGVPKRKNFTEEPPNEEADGPNRLRAVWFDDRQSLLAIRAAALMPAEEMAPLRRQLAEENGTRISYDGRSYLAHLQYDALKVALIDPPFWVPLECQTFAAMHMGSSMQAVIVDAEKVAVRPLSEFPMVNFSDGMLVKDMVIGRLYYHSSVSGPIDSANYWFFENLKSYQPAATPVALENKPLGQATCGIVASYFAAKLLGRPTRFEALQAEAVDNAPDGSAVSMKLLGRLLELSGVPNRNVSGAAVDVLAVAPYAIAPVRWSGKHADALHYVIASRAGENVKVTSPCDPGSLLSLADFEKIWNGVATVFPVTSLPESPSRWMHPMTLVGLVIMALFGSRWLWVRRGRRAIVHAR